MGNTHRPSHTAWRSRWGGVLALPTLILTLLFPCDSAALTLKVRARLRQGPSKDTALLGWVDPGIALEELGMDRGWHQVRTPEGTVGYVWKEHVATPTSPTSPPSSLPATPTTTTLRPTTPTTMPAPTRAESVVATPPTTTHVAPVPAVATDDLRVLKDDLRALRERHDQAVSRLDRLQTTVDRIATLLEGGTPPPAALQGVSGAAPRRTDVSPAAALVFLVLGGALGLGIGRFFQHSRDRRQRLKVRL